MRELCDKAVASAHMVVCASDLASSLGDGGRDVFPPVLATARMVALMEIAAARVLKPILEHDELSVGVKVDISHTAATPIGATVHAHASFLGREGLLYKFEVVAMDVGGEIGRGLHHRAIIKNERFLSGAVARILEQALCKDRASRMKDK